MWQNSHYPELAKLQQAPRWCKWGITNIHHIFKDGALESFEKLSINFCFPKPMLFDYIQLMHAVEAQGLMVEWQQSATPVFNIMAKTCQQRDLFLDAMQCYLIIS